MITTDMIGFIVALIILALLFVLSQRGRTGHPGLEKLRGFHYAHRGLHSQGVPENSMLAFRNALEKGYGIEFDVHLMADGELAIIHDASLKRTAGVDVKIEDLTLVDLENYRLEGTQEKIPTFRELLALYAGKAPLIIELKPERNNHAALCQAVLDALQGYEGAWCLESFDPRCVYWLRKNRPEVVRGQLAENFLGNPSSKLPWILKWVLSWQLENFLVQPDFIAYRFVDRKNLAVWVSRNIWKLQGVTWTLKTPDQQADADREGWISIFEDYLP